MSKFLIFCFNEDLPKTSIVLGLVAYFIHMAIG